MIRIATNISRAALRWPQTIVTSGWRRIWMLSPKRRHVRPTEGSSRWTVWQEDAPVFSGDKQQCEDWLDWKDHQKRKNAAGKQS
jgi:hypothetical protein